MNQIIKGVLVQRADVANRSGRLYSRAVLERVVEDAKKRETPYPGMLYPETDDVKSGYVSMAQTSHHASNLRMEGNDLVCDIETTDTIYGKMLVQAVELGVTPDFVLFGTHRSVQTQNAINIYDYTLIGIHAVKERS